MKKRIASIVAVYPPYGGGLGVVAQENARMLSADFDVTVFTPRYPRMSEKERNDGGVFVRFIRPVFSSGNAAFIPQVLWAARSFDAIHLHYPFLGACIPAIIGALLWQKKLVITYHMDLIGKKQPRRAIFLFANIIAPLLVSLGHRILVTSYDYAESSAIASLLKKYPEKIVELHNSVDTELFKPIQNELNREKTILFVGGLDSAHYFKGVEILLNACEILSKTVSFRLVLVGSGDGRKYFEETAERLGISNRVQFAGSLCRRDLAAAMANADVLVLPSLDRSEAFGVVLIEAGACGKPVIASALPGVRSVIEHGVTGLLVRPGDENDLLGALSDMLTNSSRAQAMGEAGRIRALNHYSNKVVGEKLRGLFSKLTAKS